MSTGDIKQCEEVNHHAQIPGTGSCWCGFKKYSVKKELDMNNLPRCGWCSAPPSIANIRTRELFCATEGCPAFSNVVSAERWCQRGKHEMAVMWIPLEEPIFVLRGQDNLSLVPIYTWIDLGEKRKVNQEKLDGAVVIAEEFQAYQRAEKSKLPD